MEDVLNIFYNSDKKEQYIELFYYLASLLQQPSFQLPINLFKSAQGTGKILIFETLFGLKIIGKDYFAISEKIDFFLGRFNSALKRKLFVILD